MIKYLQEPKGMIDKKVWWRAQKFVLDNGELYRRMADDLLLMCLGLDQATLAMVEVHKRSLWYYWYLLSLHKCYDG
jgi:hypothetical protein